MTHDEATSSGDLVSMYDLRMVPDLLRNIGLFVNASVLLQWGEIIDDEISKRHTLQSGHNPSTASSSRTGVDVGDLLTRHTIHIDWQSVPQGSQPSQPSSVPLASVNNEPSELVESHGINSLGLQPIAVENASPIRQLDHLLVQSMDQSVLNLSKKTMKQITDLARKDFDSQKSVLSSLDEVGIAKHWFQQLAYINNQDTSVAKTRKLLKVKNQKIRRLEMQVVKHKEQLELAKMPSTSLEVNRQGRRLTWRTSIIIGLRKLMCIVSANAFPLASLINISRWTVTRCEVLAWALILGRIRSWHIIVKHLLKYVCENVASVTTSIVPASSVRDLDDDDDDNKNTSRKSQRLNPIDATVQTQDEAIRKDHDLPSACEWVSLINLPVSEVEYTGAWNGIVASTFFCSDATNAAIWNRQKLQGLEVRCMILVNRRALDKQDYATAFKTLKCMFLADVGKLVEVLLFELTSLNCDVNSLGWVCIFYHLLCRHA